MRKSFGALAVITTFLAVSSFAYADDDFYIGANLVRITDKGDQAPAIHPLAVGIKGGVELSPNFAVEARYTKGVKSDSATMSGFKVDLDLDEVYGVYVKGILPLGGVSPYLLVGYSHGQETAKVKAFGLSSSDSDSGTSFGVGVDIPVTKSVSVNAEWARLVKGTDDQGVGFKIEGLSVGIATRF